MTVDDASSVVVKVGGSLHDLPRLGERLRAWLVQLPMRQVLLIPGGGLPADWVRAIDRLDLLGEETAHWLALRALSFTSFALAARLGQADVIEDIEDRYQVWHAGRWPILDLYCFARADDARQDHLPHSWDVTSDALAAQAALQARIPRLVLLKSVSWAEGGGWAEAARRGIVDAVFPEVLARAGPRLQASAVNFRQWSAPASSAEVPPESRP
jgi:aspartokinase-like uncharacterized kinase